MNSDAYIDGTSLRSIGTYMGDNFLDALLTPPQLKDFISNDARTRHGVQIMTSAPRYAARDLTLAFVICGDTPKEAAANRAALLTMLGRVRFGLYVPCASESETFWLAYTGKSVSFAQDLSHTVCKLTAKFTEPDPTARELATWVSDIEK